MDSLVSLNLRHEFPLHVEGREGDQDSPKLPLVELGDRYASDVGSKVRIVENFYEEPIKQSVRPRAQNMCMIVNPNFAMDRKRTLFA